MPDPVISVRMPPQLLEQLSSVANALDTNRADLIRTILARDLGFAKTPEIALIKEYQKKLHHKYQNWLAQKGSPNL
jgi:hypothetical protein